MRSRSSIRRTLITALLPLLAVAPAAEAQRVRPTTPIEALPAFVARFTAAMQAVQQGNCAEFKRLNLNGGLDAYACDERQRRALEGFTVHGYRQFGTGAIVDITARDVQRFQLARSTVELVLGPDRRFQTAGSPIFGPAGRSGVPQLGTKAMPRVAFLARRTARLAVVSLRTRNCNLFFTTWFTGTLTKAQACARVFTPRTTPANRSSNIRRLRLQLAGDSLVRPISLGGTRDIQFFSLLLRTGHYYTLLVDRSGVPGNFYLTSTRAVY